MTGEWIFLTDDTLQGMNGVKKSVFIQDKFTLKNRHFNLVSKKITAVVIYLYVYCGGLCSVWVLLWLFRRAQCVWAAG